VKGGGRHVSGAAVCDGGPTLDLSPVDGVRVDPEARTARVGAGATWGDVDHKTGAFGLAIPGGQDPNIGVAGLTLGGGGLAQPQLRPHSDCCKSVPDPPHDGVRSCQ